MIKVLVVDDHMLFSQTLAEAIRQYDDIDMVGILHNGQEAIYFVENSSVDVILMDIEMPIVNGLNATKVIKESHDETKIIIISSHDKKGFISNAMQAGASGYMLKSSSKEELLTAIRTVALGGTYYQQPVVQSLIDKIDNPQSLIMLSDKEKKILHLISQGDTIKEISDKVFMSEHTVDRYKRKLVEKFEAKNITSLVAKAISNGYIDIE